MSVAGRDTEPRLSREEMSRLLDMLETRQAKPVECTRRSVRLPLRGLAVLVTPLTSTGEHNTHCVWTRNISQHGLAFLDKNMMAVGSLLRIQLPIDDSEGNPIDKEAIVRRCRHVAGMIHEIGVEFCAFANLPPKRHPPG
jgi:hypothetical protein